MTRPDPYDEVYALFAGLADRASELSDEQHVSVMEAFNTFTEVERNPPDVLPAPDAGSAAHLLGCAADSLACLIDVTADGRAALQYARAHAHLMAALAA